MRSGEVKRYVPQSHPPTHLISSSRYHRSGYHRTDILAADIIRRISSTGYPRADILRAVILGRISSSGYPRSNILSRVSLSGYPCSGDLRADILEWICQRSTGDPRLILGKGYRLVVLGGYGRTDPLLNKPFYPNGILVGILTWYQSEGLGFESQYVHFGHPSAGGCQRSTGDLRLIIGKGYRLVVLGGYGCTDLLLNKPFNPNADILEPIFSRGYRRADILAANILERISSRGYSHADILARISSQRISSRGYPGADILAADIVERISSQRISSGGYLRSGNPRADILDRISSDGRPPSGHGANILNADILAAYILTQMSSQQISSSGCPRVDISSSGYPCSGYHRADILAQISSSRYPRADIYVADILERI
ncbi:unnamed protein product [Closterium sp. NIES-54]